MSIEKPRSRATISRLLKNGPPSAILAPGPGFSAGAAFWRRGRRGAAWPREAEFGARSRVSSDQPGQPDRVVSGGGEGEGEGPADPIGAAEFCLALTGDSLHSAERFLDAFSDALARRVAGMARRAPVNGRAATVRLSCSRSTWSEPSTRAALSGGKASLAPRRARGASSLIGSENSRRRRGRFPVNSLFRRKSGPRRVRANRLRHHPASPTIDRLQYHAVRACGPERSCRGS